MPYIKKEDREVLDYHIQQLANLISFEDEFDGLVNYSITKLIVEIKKRVDFKYHEYNSIIGALECCKLELYRRQIAPYEDKKIKTNGDVY